MCVCGRAVRARCAECSGSRRRELELAVRDVLEQHEETRGFAWNARAGNTAYRPDFLWTFPEACVMLEVDENAHRAYDKEAERVRERAVAEALGRPVRVFRLLLPRLATRECAARSASALVPTLACRIAEAQDRKKKPAWLE
jgi:hypothetical protein